MLISIWCYLHLDLGKEFKTIGIWMCLKDGGHAKLCMNCDDVST